MQCEQALRRLVNDTHVLVYYLHRKRIWTQRRVSRHKT